MKKLLLILLAIVYFPVAYIWAIIWGIIGGFIYKIVATYEDFYAIIRTEIRLWRRYNYTARKRDDLYAVKKKTNFFEQDAKSNTMHMFPAINIVGYLLIAIVFLPFRCVSGVFSGPIILCQEVLIFWKEKVLKVNPEDKYKILYELQQKVNRGECYEEDIENEFIFGKGVF